MKGKSSYGLVIVSLLVIAFIVLLARGNLSFLDPVKSAHGLKTNITSADVVAKLRSASYLTTTKYTIQVIAKAEQDANWYKLWSDSYKLLLHAKGTVEAGVDLSKVTSADVVVSADGKKVTVTNPPVSIHRREFSLSQDKNDTYVINIDSKAFADLTKVQTQLRNDANNAVVKSACKAGIMERATLDASLATEDLLKTIWPDVEVNVIPGLVPSVEECSTAE